MHKSIVIISFVAYIAHFNPYNTAAKADLHDFLPLTAYSINRAHQQINQLLEFPSPDVFVKDYVVKSRAVVFKSIILPSNAVRFWNDEYIRKQYGEETVSVDLANKENRTKPSEEMSMNQFLSRYLSEDIYMISTLPYSMRKDIIMPKPLQSKTITGRLQDYVIWFTNGGSKSHLHFDTVENLFCLLAGEKEWLLADKEQSNGIIFDRQEGDYCSVDVDAVDTKRYPFLLNTLWHNVTLEAGDCIYVPSRWAHHVRSSKRNIAVNIWWAPFIKSDVKVESKDNSVPENPTLADFKFNYAEQYRYFLHKTVDEHHGSLSFAEISSLIISEHDGRKIISVDDFNLLDSDHSGYVTLDEISDINASYIEHIFDGIEPGIVNTVGKYMKTGIETNHEEL